MFRGFVKNEPVTAFSDGTFVALVAKLLEGIVGDERLAMANFGRWT